MFLNCSSNPRTNLIQAEEDDTLGTAWRGTKPIDKEHTIDVMPIGSQGYTMNAAMLVDAEGCFWLNPLHSVLPSKSAPGGTLHLKVALTEDGYFVGLSDCLNVRWSPDVRYTDPFTPIPVENIVARTV